MDHSLVILCVSEVRSEERGLEFGVLTKYEATESLEISENGQTRENMTHNPKLNELWLLSHILLSLIT